MSCRNGKLFMNVKMHRRIKEFESKELHKRSPHRQQRSRMVFQKNTCRIVTHLRSCTVMFSSLAWILILWQWRQYYQGQVGYLTETSLILPQSEMSFPAHYLMAKKNTLSIV